MSTSTLPKKWPRLIRSGKLALQGLRRALLPLLLQPKMVLKEEVAAVAAKAEEARPVAEVAARAEAKVKTAATSVGSLAAITLMAAIAASPKRALPMVALPQLVFQPVLARP